MFVGFFVYSFLLAVVLGFVWFGFLGGISWGFLYLFNLFLVDSVFLELLKVYRPQTTFSTCQHKDATSSASACLSDTMPMLLESLLG